MGGESRDGEVKCLAHGIQTQAASFLGPLASSPFSATWLKPSEVAGHGGHRQWVRGVPSLMESAGGGWDPSEKGSECHSRALTPGTRGVLGEADESRAVGGEVMVYRG